MLDLVLVYLVILMVLAIPTAIWGLVSNNRLRKENRSLRWENQALRGERAALLREEGEPATPGNAKPTSGGVPPAPAPPAAHPLSAASVPAQGYALPRPPQPGYTPGGAPGQVPPAPYQPPAGPVSGSGHMPPQPAAPQPVAPPPRRAKPANVLLIIGVVLITLAGVVFTATAWHRLGTAPRILLVFSQSALFFLVSVLAHKKLQLRNTGLAFFVLGGVYLPLAILAAGAFELFGPGFSLLGPGRYVVVLLAFAALGGAAAVGALVYRQRQFVWAALLCLLGTVVSLSLVIVPAADIAALTAAVYCGAFLLLQKPLAGRAEKGAGRVRLFIAEARQVGLLQTVAAALGFLLVMGRGFSGFATALLFALLLLHPAFTKAQKAQGLSAIPAALYLLLALFLLAPPRAGWTPGLLVTGVAALLLVQLTGVLPEKAGRMLVRTALAALVPVALYTLTVLDGWTLWLLLASALLTASVTLLALGGNRLLLWLQPLSVANLLWGAAWLLAGDTYRILTLLGFFAIAAFFLYALLARPLRTPLSDGLFLLLACLGQLPARPWPQLALLCLALAGMLLETRRHHAAGWFVPLLLALLTLPLARVLRPLLPVHGWPLWAGMLALLAALGIWAALSGKGWPAKALRQPLMVAVPLYSAALTVWAIFMGGFLWMDVSTLLWVRLIPLVPAAALLLLRLPAGAEKNLRTLACVWLYTALVFCLWPPAAGVWGWLVCCVLLCAAGVAGPLRFGKSLWSLPAVAGLYLYIGELYRHARFALPALPAQLDAILFPLLFLLLGRLLRQPLWSPKEKRADWFTLLAPLAAARVLLVVDATPGWLLLALAALAFWRRTGSERGDRLSLTGALAAVGAAAWWWLVPIAPAAWASLLVWAPLLAVLALLHLLVWRRGATARLLFLATVLCTLWLAVDAIVYSRLHYALVVGIGALAVLLAAYAGRSRRWFAYATVTLIALGIYLSRSFWASLAWWVYLLGAGILLLAIGAVNERGKQRDGAGLKSKLAALFRDWR